MPNIHIMSSDGRIYNFPIIKDLITIGRNSDSDIIFNDNTVSRNHAQIVKTDEGYFINDLGSFNGTKLNERSIQSALLRNDDQIKVGLNKITFLTQGKEKRSLADSLVLTPENDSAEVVQQIVKSSPQDERRDSEELLVSVEAEEETGQTEFKETIIDANPQAINRAELSTLERSNKVLFVLYEISRKLNAIQDFNELLQNIMDLILMVIDADYGFLILTGSEEDDELIPVVVKYKDDKIPHQGKQLEASKSIINKVIKDKVSLLTSNAMTDSRLDHGKSLFIRQIKSAMCVPLWKKDKIIGVIQLDSVRYDNQFTNDDLELLKAIGSQMAMIIEQASLNEQIREEEQMRSRLERFHSPQVIEMILKGGQETKDNIMDPQDLTATILFTDIIGFSRLAEQMPPRETNMILNQYFSRMTDVVFKYDGMLDKYVGDGLMAVFGAPMEKDDDAERAIRAALEMRRELESMMDRMGDERKFKIRTGINTGRVVAGNIGSPRRMDYTVIGDPVNISSRLESIAGPNQILIGEETYNLVKGKFKIKKEGPKKVKGKSAEILVYEILG